MQKILISACLLGKKVRFDGGDNDCRNHDLIKKWLEEGRLISICPELEGGLSIPRDPAVITKLNNNISVITSNNKDVTINYQAGAEKALELANKYNIKVAILKNRSPSCGSTHIYSNLNPKKIIEGFGITAGLLKEHGVAIFHEEQIDQVADYLEKLV